VVTATIGFDHLDTQWLDAAGIRWTNCPGCNSGSVAQYVECALLLLEQQKGLSLRQSTIGIVGCGHVGSKVKAVAERLGMSVMVCDPPLGRADYVTMDTIEHECDVITFHVPLTRQEPYATWHLADSSFFGRLRRVPYIINTSRGEVVDNKALLVALTEGSVRDAVIDVWENEPHPDAMLLDRVFIGTPHIAGYSADGKVNADNMVIDAICQHFHLPRPPRIVPPSLPVDVCLTGSPLDLYNPMSDSQKLKSDSSQFEQIRNNYPLRREKID
jgi:erythronate-4-phosphate dehydrogenase